MIEFKLFVMLLRSICIGPWQCNHTTWVSSEGKYMAWYLLLGVDKIVFENSMFMRANSEMFRIPCFIPLPCMRRAKGNKVRRVRFDRA